jgi:hypothetical protein
MAMDMTLIIYLMIGGFICFFAASLLLSFMPWLHKRSREKPNDALQKLMADLKLSAKVNREREIKWVKFQGDTKVYRRTRYRVKGVIPDPRCFIFAIKTSRLTFTRIILIPPELCTNLNTAEVSVRARGVQRWNSLVWVPVLTERDQGNMLHFEQIWHRYMDYAIIQQARVEFGELSFDNWHESADGSDYLNFISRQEQIPAAQQQQEPKAGTEERL